MEISIVWIAVAGVVVGIISNLLPLLGNSFVNFALAVVLVSIHQGLQAIGFNGFSAPVIAFIQWYFVGTFGVKLLSLLPIPYVQQVAQAFAGEI